MNLKFCLTFFILILSFFSLLQSDQNKKQKHQYDLKQQIENLLQDYQQNRNLLVQESSNTNTQKYKKAQKAQQFIDSVQNNLRKLLQQSTDQNNTIINSDDNFLNQLINDVGMAMAQNQNEVMLDPKIFHLMIQYLAVLQHLRQDQTHDENLNKLKNNYKQNQKKIANILQQLEDADKELQTIKGYRKKKEKKDNYNNEAIDEIENKKKILLQQLQNTQIQDSFEKGQEDIENVIDKIKQGEEEVSQSIISANEKLEQIKTLQEEKKKLLKLEELVKQRVKQYKTVEDIEDRLENIDSNMSDLIQKGIHPDKINNLESQKQELLGVLYKEKELLEQKRDYYKLLNDQEFFDQDDDLKNKELNKIKQSKEYKKFLKDMENLSNLENQQNEKLIIFDTYLDLDKLLKKVEEIKQKYKDWFDIIEQDEIQNQDEQEDNNDDENNFRKELQLYGKMVNFSKEMNQTQKKLIENLKLIYDSWSAFDINNEKSTIKFFQLENNYEQIQDDDILSDESDDESPSILKEKEKRLQNQDEQIKKNREVFHKELNLFIQKQGSILDLIKLIIQYNEQLASTINDFLLVKENEDNLNAKNLIFQSQKYHKDFVKQKVQIEENIVALREEIKDMIFQKDILKKKIENVYNTIQNVKNNQQNNTKIKTIYILLIMIFV